MATASSSSSSSSSLSPQELLQPISIVRAEKLWDDVFAGIIKEKGLNSEEAKFVLGAASGMWKTKVSKACLASGVATPEDPAAETTEARVQDEEKRIAELSKELNALGKQAEHYRLNVPVALRERLEQSRDSNIESLEKCVNEFEGRVPESPDAGKTVLPVRTTELLNDTERRMKVAAKKFRETRLALDLLSKKKDRLTNAVSNFVPGGVKRKGDNSINVVQNKKRRKGMKQ